MCSVSPTRSSSSRARCSASSLDRPSTWTGASVMFRSTFMFGKRLNCWKTMPMFLRTSRTWLSPAGTSLPFFSSCVRYSPPTLMVPSSGFSRVISSRRIVVLPDPEGPISVTCLPESTEKSRLSRTMLLPKRLVTLSKRISSLPSTAGLADSSCGVCCQLDKTTLQGSQEKGGRVGDDDEGDADDGVGLDVVKVSWLNCLGLAEHFQRSDGGEHRRVLQHRHHVVAERGDHPADGLRQDHRAPGAALAAG